MTPSSLISDLVMERLSSQATAFATSSTCPSRPKAAPIVIYRRGRVA